MKRFALVGLTLGVIVAAAAVVSNSSRKSHSPQNIEPGFGAISGTVIGEDGKPITSAIVYARVSGQPGSGRMHTVLSDRNGKFFLNKVLLGMNTVYAYKEEDGYPDTFFAFYVGDQRAIPQVFVYEHDVANVVVQLGPKAAKVSIEILDNDTNESIEDAAIELRRAGDPGIYVSLSCIPDVNGRCQILVPVSPSNIKVSRHGYEDEDVTELMKSANPESGKTKQLAIHVRRVKSGSDIQKSRP